MKIESENDIHQAAELMQSMGAKNVLIKGGHLSILDFVNVKKQSSNIKNRIVKDFLFMDEATSALDSETEKNIQENIFLLKILLKNW